MRDNFSKKTKELLAKRVAFRCSFLGCGVNTIGPGHADDEDIVNLGEAAHINAASKMGPRFDKKMSPTDRRSIENGIWMCRQHARMIDSDMINYSASTLKQWKAITERETYESLMLIAPFYQIRPTTLITIGKDTLFEGFWISVNDDVWTFDVNRFLIGNEQSLTEINLTSLPQRQRYVVVESQGDGRSIVQNLKWERVSRNLRVSIRVSDKTPRSDPDNLADIAIDPIIINGDFALLRGENCAKQIIMLTLSTNFGDMWYSPSFGSYLSLYYWTFGNDLEILKRLFKLEITRLIAIPYLGDPNSPFYISSDDDRQPLDFINRVISVDILSDELRDDKISIQLNLEWGNGKLWEDEIDIYITPKNSLESDSELPEIVKFVLSQTID